MQRRGSTSHKYYCLELALCHAASLFTALPKNFWNLIDSLCKLVPAAKASHHLQRHWPQSQRFRLYPIVIYPPKVWNATWMKMEPCRRRFLTCKPWNSGSMLILGRVCICGTSLSLFSWAQSPQSLLKLCKCVAAAAWEKYIYQCQHLTLLWTKIAGWKTTCCSDDFNDAMPATHHATFQTNTAGRSKQIDCPAVFSEQNGGNSLLQRHLTRSKSLRTMNVCTQYISMITLVCLTRIYEETLCLPAKWSDTPTSEK